MSRSIRLGIQQRAVQLGVLSIMSCTWAPTSRRTTTPVDPGPISLSTLSRLQRHGYTAVALERDNNYTYKLKAVANSTPVTLIFDSGFSGNIVLAKSIADAVGIRGAPDDSAVGQNGYIATDTTHLPRFILGTMHFDSQFVKIAQSWPLSDGGLGAVFLSTHHVIVDYPHDVFYVHDASQDDVTLPVALVAQQGYVAIPLTRLAKQMGSRVRMAYFLRAVVNSTPVTLELDTGMIDDDLLMDEHRAEALGITTGFRLTLGGADINAPSFNTYDASPLNRRLQSYGFPQVDGLLAGRVLMSHGAIIDFDHGMLYLHSLGTVTGS